MKYLSLIILTNIFLITACIDSSKRLTDDELKERWHRGALELKSAKEIVIDQERHTCKGVFKINYSYNEFGNISMPISWECIELSDGKYCIDVK